MKCGVRRDSRIVIDATRNISRWTGTVRNDAGKKIEKIIKM